MDAAADWDVNDLNYSSIYNWTSEDLALFWDSERREASATLAKSHDFPMSYRIIATFLHGLIFIVGVLGNVLLVIAVRRYRSLQTSTYTYLMSLSVADLIVLCTAVPEAIVNHHVGKRWLFGSTGCAVFVFMNFLGINAGSMSLLTFTIERYIAVCHPLKAYRFCTVSRAKRIILAGWLLVVTYCCPWLAITEVKTESNNREQCKLKMSKEQYSVYFIWDIVIFYLVPLGFALFCYGNIAMTMERRRRSVAETLVGKNSEHDGKGYVYLQQRTASGSLGSVHGCQSRTEASVNRMLILVVVFFAIAWFPFRFLLIYNTFVRRSWLDIWYLLFAKTLIYANSAINPILYNFMSHRFRVAVKRLVGCASAGGIDRTPTGRQRNSSTLSSCDAMSIRFSVKNKNFNMFHPGLKGTAV